ncbi:glycosyltransferase family 4 protein [Candidatus Latescibacterota bacterium]
MQKSLKILQIIVQSNLRGGGAVQLFRLSKELVKRGHFVYALFDDDPEYREHFFKFEENGIDLRFIKMHRVKPDVKTYGTVRKNRALIKEKRIDIIHAHKGNAADLAWLAALGLDVPIVTNRGAAFPLNYFQAFKYRSGKIKRIIAVAHMVKDVMVETGKIDPDKIDVVWGGVDTEQFRPGLQSTLRDEFQVLEDKRIIGFVGNASPRKGLQYLIDAFGMLREKYDDIVLVAAGVSAEELKDFTISEGLGQRIIPIGFRKDVNNCMAAFDIYVFAGLVNEGLAGTLREAAAMGLPIITTDVAGNSELIQNHHSGLVVPPYDVQSLAEAIEYLLDNNDKAAEFGRAARDFVVEHMTDTKRAEKIEKIYYDILA